jgi:DNA-binding NtrC family response regulator
VAQGDATVLIHGESGTGKELVAEGLHDEGPRAGGPFIVFDCSAVAANLVESELFGHVKGAFTGAVTDRAGAFEAAHGGTLFLDEIGELPLELQPKLLRALERREVRRVGTNKARPFDARIVAATHRSLAEEVNRKAFREDLYFRLAVVTVEIPPLRERTEDIPVLIDQLARDLSHGRPVSFTEKQIETFMTNSWPGNVRELRNAVSRALSLAPASGSGSGSGSGSSPASAPASGSALPIDLSVPLTTGRDRLIDAYEKAYLEEALRSTGGNVTRAAEIAGVNRKFIQRALNRLGLRED